MVHKCFNEAAGIPRGRPDGRDGEWHIKLASMRPRVFPAEDRRPSTCPACRARLQ